PRLSRCRKAICANGGNRVEPVRHGRLGQRRPARRAHRRWRRRYRLSDRADPDLRRSARIPGPFLFADRPAAPSAPAEIAALRDRDGADVSARESGRKTIRAMADGTLDSQVGARICNGLGIMRACLETQKLEQLEARMDEIADRVARDRTNRVARDRTNAARERTSIHEAQLERLLAKVEAELACSARPRRYCFYFDEEAEAQAQGLPYVLVPRQLSREEWEKKYCHAPAVEEKKD